jgi:hypothetical protein
MLQATLNIQCKMTQQLPSFYVFTGLPITGYRSTYTIIASIEAGPTPVFEQYLITPDALQPYSRQIYRYRDVPAESIWDNQVHEAEQALDNLRLEAHRASQLSVGDLPVRSSLQPVSKQVLLQLWLQRTHQQAIEFVQRSTQNPELRMYLDAIVSVEVHKS